MEEENIPKRKISKKSYPVTVSDWIIFLNGEASTNISFYALFITIFIIMTIMYIEFNAIIEGFTKLSAVLIYLLLVFVLGSFAKIINDYYTRPYQELCQKIMEGTITEPKKILEEYHQIENVKRKKNKMSKRRNEQPSLDNEIVDLEEAKKMNTKLVWWISTILGLILAFIGIYSLYGMFFYDLPYDYFNVVYVIFGVIFLMVGLYNILFFGYGRYKLEAILAFVYALVILPVFVLFQLMGFITIFELAVYYVAVVSIIVWLFFIRFITEHKDKVPGKLFEFLFFLFLFGATYFLTFLVGRLSANSWLWDLDTIRWFIIMIFCGVSAFCSGVLHYIKQIG